MEIHILLLFVTLSLATIRFFLNHHRKKNQPPGPTGLPIIGNLHQLGPKLHCTLSSLAKTYGPIISLRLGFTTVVIASSPAVAKEILQKNDQAFANRPIPDSLTAQPNVDDTISWAAGDPLWKNRRRFCSTRLFSTQRLDLLQHLRHRKAQQLVQHLRKKASTRTAVDIGALAFATMLNLLANTVFSEDLVDSEFESAGEFKELAWRIMEDSGRLNLSDYFPVLKRFDLQGVKRHVKVSYVRLHEIFGEVIGRRVRDRESSRGASSNGDFLDVLLDHCEQEDGSIFTVESIRTMIVVSGYHFVVYTFKELLH